MRLESGKLKLYGQYEQDGWNEKIYLKQEKGGQLVLGRAAEKAAG